MTIIGYAFDCSVRLDAGDCAAALAAGYRGAVRYLGDPDEWPKALTLEEYSTILRSGLELAVVWESTARRALEGQAAGVADAHTAGGWANRLEWPAERPIYFACDTDAAAEETAGYYHGTNPAVAGTVRSSGVYAGVPVIVAALAAHDCSHGWVAAASSWSHGQSTDLAALTQLVDPPPFLGALPFSADANVVTLADWGQTPIGSPPPPAPKGRRRMIEKLTIDGVDYLFWNQPGAGIMVRSIRDGTLQTPVLIPDTGGVLPSSDLIAEATAFGPVVRAATVDGHTCTVTLIPGGWGFHAVTS